MPNILGINLSNFEEKSALKKVEEYLNGGNIHYAVTPNPEIILHALKDKNYANILNKADLSFADGFGLKIAGLLFGEKIIRITGSDFSLKLLELAQSREEKVLIINWNEGLSKKDEIEVALTQKYPQLKFLVIDTNRDNILNSNKQVELLNFAPTIIFSTLGSPYQEEIIYNNLNSWPSVRFAIGVGGTFDFITKRAKRAPGIFRNLGIEWLWRLIIQPKRIGRIYQATFVFMFKIMKHICSNKFYKNPKK